MFLNVCATCSELPSNLSTMVILRDAGLLHAKIIKPGPDFQYFRINRMQSWRGGIRAKIVRTGSSEKNARVT